MSRFLPTVVACILGAGALAPVLINSGSAKPSHAPTQMQITEKSPELSKVGYSFGYLMGSSNKQDIPDLDIGAFSQGFKDAYNQGQPAITEQQMQETLMSYKQRREAEFMQAMQAKAEANKTEGETFLATNAKKDGVKVTNSGLQYQVLTAGTGASPKASDVVEVNYEGKLLDGTVFDSSYARGESASFPLNQVIPGWTEGVQLMKEGAKYRFFIPADLAYGETGNPSIEPNSTLIFDVELLKVNPQ